MRQFMKYQKPIFWENNKKKSYQKMSSAESFIKHAEHYYPNFPCLNFWSIYAQVRNTGSSEI